MGIVSYIKEEIRVVRERDPAIKSNMEVLLYPSFRVILRYRVAHKLYLKKHLIITDNVIVKLIFKKHYSKFNRNIYGIKCNGCYGFTDEESYNITNGHNKCKDFTLIDYILRGERNG